MKVPHLLMRLRAQGGDCRLDPADDTRVQVKRGDIKPGQWPVCKKALLQDKCGLIAILREERASRYWEEAGRDVARWRTYPYSRTEAAVACTCSALPFAHHHAEPGPSPNVELDSDEDVWAALRQIVRASKPSKTD